MFTNQYNLECHQQGLSLLRLRYILSIERSRFSLKLESILISLATEQLVLTQPRSLYLRLWSCDDHPSFWYRYVFKKSRVQRYIL